MEFPVSSGCLTQGGTWFRGARTNPLVFLKVVLLPLYPKAKGGQQHWATLCTLLPCPAVGAFIPLHRDSFALLRWPERLNHSAFSRVQKQFSGGSDVTFRISLAPIFNVLWKVVKVKVDVTGEEGLDVKISNP